MDRVQKNNLNPSENENEKLTELKFITINLDVSDKTLTFLIDTASQKSILKLESIREGTRILTEFKTKIEGIAKAKPIKSVGMLIAMFKNGRRDNFLQFEIVKSNEIMIEDRYDGIIGLNILNDSEINLLKNYISLKDNDLLIPMNLEGKEHKKFLKAERSRNHNAKKIIKLNNEENDEENLREPNPKSTQCLKTEFKYNEPILIENLIPIRDKYERFEKLKALITIKTENEESREKALQIIENHVDTFFLENDQIPLTTLLKHKIVLTDDKPIFEKQYPIKASMEEITSKIIKKMISDKTISPCDKSNYSHSFFLIKKPGGNEFRLVSDLRKLNAKIINSYHPIPRVDDIIFNLKGNKFMSTLDIKSAYWSIGLEEESKHLTSFYVPNSDCRGRYVYNALIMGLSDSQSSFLKLIEMCLGDLLGNCVIAYVDDLLVLGDTENQALENLNLTLNALKKAGLRIEPKKSIILAREVKFLGHLITQEGIKIDKSKVDIITKMPRPKGIKQLRSSLGIFNYYRKAINNFAEITIPLYNLLTNANKSFKWNAECEDSFETAKKAIANAPTLHFLAQDLEILITTDASKFAVAGILSQINKEGEEVPVAFCSKRLPVEMRATSSFERELFAVTNAICHAFKDFVYGRAFKVKTDNKSLIYIMNNKLDTANDRIIRMRLKLMQFDFKILFQSGKNANHLVVDALSRIKRSEIESSSEEEEDDDDNFPSIKAYMITRNQTKMLNNAVNDEYENFLETIDKNTTPTNIKNSLNTIKIEENPNIVIIFTIKNQFAYQSALEKLMENILKKNTLKVNEMIMQENIFLLTFKTNRDDRTIDKDIYLLTCKCREELRKKNNKRNIDIAFTIDPRIPNVNLLKIFAHVFKDENIKLKLYQNDTEKIESREEMERIIANYHASLDSMHLGVQATYDKLKKIYEWPNMKVTIADYIKSCQSCLRNKRDYNHKTIPLRVVAPRSNSCFETIFLDVVGPLPVSNSNNRFIITMLCELTRFLIAVAVPETDSNTIAQVLVHNLYMPYSLPRTIITDNAKNLNSEIMTKLCKLLRVKKINTTIYHPESNLVERCHGPLKTAIKAYIDKDLRNWDELLGFASCLHNFTKHESTKFSPFFLIYGKEARTIHDTNVKETRETYEDYIERVKSNINLATKIAKENMLKAREKCKERYDKENKVKESDIKAGDEILIKTHYNAQKKLLPSFEGPFTVVKVNEQYVIILDKKNKTQPIHKNLIKKYFNAIEDVAE